MARMGSGVKLPDVGATVRHPLWPELGDGAVESVNKTEAHNKTCVCGRIRWSCGQVSTHNLSVLREVG